MFKVGDAVIVTLPDYDVTHEYVGETARGTIIEGVPNYPDWLCIQLLPFGIGWTCPPSEVRHENDVIALARTLEEIEDGGR